MNIHEVSDCGNNEYYMSHDGTVSGSENQQNQFMNIHEVSGLGQ